MGYLGYLVTCLLLLLLLLTTFGDTHCPSYCPPYDQPVCGSNGKTYHSYCELQRAACRFPILGILLTKVHDGPCGVSVVSVGQCPRYCHDGHSPVCGSDGITYSSECRFRQAACRDRYLTIRYRGPCGGFHEYPGISSGCNNYCHGRYFPVCGSDGRTYNSECELRQAACRNRFLKKRHNGPCGYRNNCNFYCAEHYDPVCGSDDRTYSNECQLKQAACTNRYLTQIYRGSCGWGKIGPQQQKKPVQNTDVLNASDGDKTTLSTPTGNNTT